MSGQPSKTTGTITLCLAAVLVISCLPASLAAAQSPEICAPVERLDKYRFLRQLTLDLYGRIPTVEEYERLHSMDDVTDELIDEMIGSTEFFTQLRRYHRNLLWANLGEDDLVGQVVEEERSHQVADVGPEVDDQQHLQIQAHAIAQLVDIARVCGGGHGRGST